LVVMAINQTNMSLSANALTLSLPENKAVESRLELLLQIELFYAPPYYKDVEIIGA